MNADQLAILLASAFGVALSLAFSFFPPLADWYYGEVGSKWRGLIMAGFGVLFSVVLYLLLCVWYIPVPGVELTCGAPGIFTLLSAFISFILSNLTTYHIMPKSPKKRENM